MRDSFLIYFFFFLFDLDFRSFHQTQRGEAIQRLAYVPAIIPTIIGIEKLRIEDT